MLPTLLAALVPLALAALPCPVPAKEDEVCGVNGHTYPSLFYMKQYGVDSAHPGRCATNGPGSATSNRKESKQYDECARRSQCDNCPMCDDLYCYLMCSKNCICGCMGITTAAQNYSAFVECTRRDKLYAVSDQCLKNCRWVDEECKAGCMMRRDRGSCACLLEQTENSYGITMSKLTSSGTTSSGTTSSGATSSGSTSSGTTCSGTNSSSDDTLSWTSTVDKLLARYAELKDSYRQLESRCSSVSGS